MVQKNIIQEKRKNDECIILHPTLNDLFCNNLYRLKHKNETYNIPLWHKSLVYEHENSELYIKCIPNTPENVFIETPSDFFVGPERLPRSEAPAGKFFYTDSF